MLAPPRPPSHQELEALIKEARARQLRRRLLGAAGVAIAAAVALSAYVLAVGPDQRMSGTSSNQAGSATGCGVTGGWRLRLEGLWSEPTGQHTVPLAVTRTGTQPCTLDGYPTVVLINGQGQQLAFRYSHHDQVVTSHPPRVVHVGGHGSAFFIFNKYRCDIRARSSARWVRIQLPGVSGWLVTPLGNRRSIDYCPAEPPSTTVAVSPLEPKLSQASWQPPS